MEWVCYVWILPGSFDFDTFLMHGIHLACMVYTWIFLYPRSLTLYGCRLYVWISMDYFVFFQLWYLPGNLFTSKDKKNNTCTLNGFEEISLH